MYLDIIGCYRTHGCGAIGITHHILVFWNSVRSATLAHIPLVPKKKVEIKKIP